MVKIMNINKLKEYFLNLFDKDKRFLTLAKMNHYYPQMPDDEYIKRVWKAKMGTVLNLDNPETFNEKIQWLKLYDRKPEYTTMVDKYAVKKYVADKIGEQYIIPTFGVWDKFDDIDFGKLPNQFVLKCTHDSGGLVICRDKSKFDIKAARNKLNHSLRKNYFYGVREWSYKNVPPRIIAEMYMEDQGRIVPEDYKIYCLNGEPKYIVVFHNRYDNTKILSETVYDINWTPQYISLDEHFAVSDIIEPKPKCLEEMLKICRILCDGFAQVRVDFYIINEHIYFGEITLYTASGLQPMIPPEMDLKIGKMLHLPDKCNDKHDF